MRYMSEAAPYGSHEPGAPPDPEVQARKLAAKRVKAKREFRSHLFAYVLVNGVISGVRPGSSVARRPWKA